MHKLITKMLAAVVNKRFNDIMLKKDANKNQKNKLSPKNVNKFVKKIVY